MSVGHICQREVDLADLDESVMEAAERMHQHTVGTLLVLDDGKRPIGFVTDRDLVIRVVAKGLDASTTIVRDVMTPHPETVTEQTVIDEAVSLMRTKGVRRLPVVDDEGRLAGVVSLDDVMMLLSEEMAEVGRLLEQQTPRAAAKI